MSPRHGVQGPCKGRLGPGGKGHGVRCPLWERQESMIPSVVMSPALQTSPLWPSSHLPPCSSQTDSGSKITHLFSSYMEKSKVFTPDPLKVGCQVNRPTTPWVSSKVSCLLSSAPEAFSLTRTPSPNPNCPFQVLSPFSQLPPSRPLQGFSGLC